MLVQSVRNMDDETLMLHLENRHQKDMRMTFDGPERRLGEGTRSSWDEFHEALHRLNPNKYGHDHGEARG